MDNVEKKKHIGLMLITEEKKIEKKLVFIIRTLIWECVISNIQVNEFAFWTCPGGFPLQTFASWIRQFDHGNGIYIKKNNWMASAISYYGQAKNNQLDCS